MNVASLPATESGDTRCADSQNTGSYRTHNSRAAVLPNELLHKILLTVICNAVHTLCVSPGDTVWERGVMETLHQVSPAFRAIAAELTAKAFDLPRSMRVDETSMLRTIRKIFTYLSHLGTRLRHPQDWGSVSFQTIDCTASSFVFAYALYLSCISLRRNATKGPRDVFESTHTVILSALAQSEALCARVAPREITIRLREGIEEEFALATDGLVLVHAFNELDHHASSMRILYSDQGPLAALRAMIHTSLLKVEGVHESYGYHLAMKMERDSEPAVHELPGVLPALRNISALTFGEEDEYELEARIEAIVSEWAKKCPFLNSSSKRRNF